MYEYGLKEKVELPEALKDLSTSIVAWNPTAIIDAINGTTAFQNPDGSAAPRQDGHHVNC